MGRLVDCQVAIVPWGNIARFRRSKVGLMRKGQQCVYLTVFSNVENDKFLVDRNTLEVLPAAIRLKELGKDLFIRLVAGTDDEQRYKTMLRQLKVILNRDKLSETGKANLNLLLSNIPSIASLTRQDTQLKPRSVQLKGSTNRSQLLEATIGFGDDGDGDCDDNNGRHRDDDVIFEEIENTSTTRTVNLLRGAAMRQLDNQQLHCIKINGLDPIPKQLWSRPTLLQLTLSDCNLTSVPKQLERFAKTLKFLDLSHNRIDELPRAFCCKMNDLNELNLSNNKLETLPIEIKFFHRLVDLNISDNRLRMLPSTFSDLRMLRKLNVANNNLSQLPAFRTDQIRLDYLDVSYNPLDGASHEANTFEVYPSNDGQLGSYQENLFCPLTAPPKKKPFPKLFEIAMLNVVRCDELLKLASEESLPKTIVLTMQRDIFKCYKCSKMNILPAYNSTDILDYVEQVRQLVTTGNYRRGMTFMKLICSTCFDQMRS